MKEKRIRLISGKNGENRVETISGFAGGECIKTVDLIINGMGNAKPLKSGDTADMFKPADSSVRIKI